MYIPAHFNETDIAVLCQFIDEHPFALLVSQADGAPFVTHLPLVLDQDAGPNGTLLGHVARPNPQWRELAGQKVLCVFNGPHAYISPTWYDADKVVPTWNYVAVHIYGHATLIEDPLELVNLVSRLTERMERQLPAPWKFDEADPFVNRLAAGIVGFRIEIERIEGKWKLNQNHPPERRRKVIGALRERGGEDAMQIADLIEHDLGM
jgi:transcriptional regulator